MSWNNRSSTLLYNFTRHGSTLWRVLFELNLREVPAMKNQPVKEADSDTNVLHFSNQVNAFTSRWWKRSNR